MGDLPLSNWTTGKKLRVPWPECLHVLGAEFRHLVQHGKPPKSRSLLKQLVNRAKALKRDVVALSFAIRDPECPRRAKFVAWVVVAYALSPIDLIPDIIPVIGIIDDLILVPFGIVIVERMIPPEVMARARVLAGDSRIEKASMVGLAIVLSLWVAFIIVGIVLVNRWRHAHR